MFFSVIIPIYNAEKTLERCLISVKNQQFSDFEVIMVDDGSLDQSRQIAEGVSCRDKRFRYLYQKNSGVSSARNLGLSEAEGEYITFLDSDDIYYPTYLSSFADMIQKYPEHGHYWCAFEEIDSNGKESGKVYSFEDGGAMSLSNREHILTLHGKTLASAPWNKAFRKEVVQELQMRPNLSLGEDEVFNFEYLDKNPDNRIVINNAPQYGYLCVSNDSLNTKYRANLLEIYEELNRAEEYYVEKWRLPEKEKALFNEVKYYRYEKALWNTFSAKNEMPYHEKYPLNNRIIQSADFQNCLSGMNGKLNKLLFIAYKSKRFEIVMLLNKAAKMKSKMRKKGAIFKAWFC